MQNSEPISTSREVNTAGDAVIRSNHPAFGQAHLSRRSGGPTYMHGSDFAHHSVVAMTISKGEAERHLNTDWYYSRDKLVEVHFSEAQWATFVSSFGSGSGVPCTLVFADGRCVPEIESLPDRRKQVDDEVREVIDKSITSLDSLSEEIKALKLPAKRCDSILQRIQTIQSKLKSDTQFVVNCFDEHVEETVEKAKVEVHAYTNQALLHAGLLATGANPPLLMGGGSDETETQSDMWCAAT